MAKHSLTGCMLQWGSRDNPLDYRVVVIDQDFGNGFVAARRGSYEIAEGGRPWKVSPARLYRLQELLDTLGDIDDPPLIFGDEDQWRVHPNGTNAGQRWAGDPLPEAKYVPVKP